MSEQPWTPQETAQFLKVEVQLVHRLLKSGKLEGCKVGSHWRIMPEKVEEFLRSGGCRTTTASGGSRDNSSSCGRKAESAADTALERLRHKTLDERSENLSLAASAYEFLAKHNP